MTSTISTGVTNTLKRTSSFANALKNLAFPHHEDDRISQNHALSNKLDASDFSRPPSPNLNFAQYTSPYSRPTTPVGRSWDTPQLQGKKPKALADEKKQQPIDFQPSDVMEAMMEEDMERLKARRRAGAASRRGHHGSRHHHSHHHPQHNGGDALASPSGSTFSNDSNASVILGLGTGAGIRDVLPLKSRCYDWCSEYFKEPQMRVRDFLSIIAPCVLMPISGNIASGER